MAGETWLQSYQLGKESLGTATVETLTTTGTPSGGTFTLNYNGQTTTALQFNESAANVQAALRALSNIGGTLISCSGGPLPSAIPCTFSGTLLGPQPAFTSTNTFSGGSSPTLVVANAPGTSAVGVAVAATRKMYFAVGDKLTRTRKSNPHPFMVGRRDNVLAETAGPVSAGGTVTMPLSSSEVIEPMLAAVRGGVVPTSLAAGTAAVQTISSTATGGSFTLTFGAYTTASIGPVVVATGPTAATIATALNLLPSIAAAGGVVGSGGPFNTPAVMTFLATAGPQPLITVNNVSTTGGTVTSASTTPGVLSANLWTFTPGNVLDSQTWQWFDGARAWNELGVRIADWKISGSVEAPTMFSATLAGTNLLAGPITGALFDRTPDFHEGWETNLYIDAFGTAPGVTKISGTMLSWEVAVNNTVDYKYTADNTLAANAILLGALVATAKVKFEAAPTIALTEFNNWDNSGTATPVRRMIRLQFGNNTVIQGAFNTLVSVDIPCAATMVDLGQIDGATRCYEISYQYVYDPTNLFGLQIRCQNARTTAY